MHEEKYTIFLLTVRHGRLSKMSKRDENIHIFLDPITSDQETVPMPISNKTAVLRLCLSVELRCASFYLFQKAESSWRRS